MQNRRGLFCKNILINCHCHTHGDRPVCRYTVNLAFERLQPKITNIHIIKKVKIMREGGKRQGINKCSNI